MMKKRNIPRAFALDAEVAQWLVDTAAADNRTPSNYLATLLSRIRDGQLPGLPDSEKPSITHPEKAAAYRKRVEMNGGKRINKKRVEPAAGLDARVDAVLASAFSPGAI